MRTGEDVVEVIKIFGWRIPTITVVDAEAKTEQEWIEHVVFLFESDMHVEIGRFSFDDLNLSEAKQWKYAINFRKGIDDVVAEG
jgi:hypothetical protein